MIRRSWRTHLKATTTQEAVLTVVSQFLDEWTPGEISLLPPEAWPQPITSRSALLAHAFRLGRMHSEFQGPSESLFGLQELLLFFTHAAVRITQLATLAQHGVERLPTRSDLPRPAAAPAPSKPVADEER